MAARAIAAAAIAAGLGVAGVAYAAPQGPWSKAKAGDWIKYRLSDPYAQNVRSAGTVEVTELVTAADASKVEVKITRREEGKDDQVSTQRYPRSLEPQQLKQFYATIGPKKDAVTESVAGVKLKCDRHVIVQPRKAPENTLTGTTVLCQDVPGWMFSQSVKREKDAKANTWFQLLEFKR